MAVGVRTTFTVLANVLFTSNIVPATVGLRSPIAANQTQKFRAWIPFTVGATGGVRLLMAVPAGGTIFDIAIKLFNTVAPSLTTAEQQAAAAFTNALANAGDHWIEVEGTIINGATAGFVDITMAQNTSDVLTLTVKRGGTMEVVTL
jgi:hypothetical protein